MSGYTELQNFNMDCEISQSWSWEGILPNLVHSCSHGWEGGYRQCHTCKLLPPVNISSGYGWKWTTV